MSLLLALCMSAFAQEPSTVVVQVESPVEAAPAEKASPMRVVIAPGVGWNAEAHRDVHGASAGLWAHARSVNGVDGQAFGSLVKGDLRGAQGSGFLSAAGGDVVGVQGAGFVSGAGGDLRGAQGAGLVSVAGGDVRGAQGAGFVNVAGGEVTGVQGAGFANVAGGDVRGAQGAGFVNVAAGSVVGVQASGAANVARTVTGVQASGGLNVAERVKGVQAGIVNVAGEVKGVQAGVLNVAKKTDGVTIGLVNIAKSSDAVNVGLLNFVGDGIHSVDVWASESSALTVDAKFGGKHLYTIVGVGTVRLNDPWWTVGAGMGVHVPVAGAWVEVDASAWGLARQEGFAHGTHNKLRATLGLKLAKHLTPFGGASLNTWWSHRGRVTAEAVGLPSARRQGGRVTAWPGLHAGVQF